MSRPTPASWHIRRSRDVLRCGGVIAYPTEAVWGLGCLPSDLDAVARILQIKRRPANKGLILIAAEWSQLHPWVADAQAPLSTAQYWPGHVTCLVNAADGISPLICGEHPRVAVRLSAHPLVRALCNATGSALISTSANRHGRATPRNAWALWRQLGKDVDSIVPGACGHAQQASRIIDPTSGTILRP
ncbi:MAG: L-threonylcarbamoyladenylate synthase [Oceanococcus sp.]